MSKKSRIEFSHFNADGPMYCCSNCGIEVPRYQILYDKTSNEMEEYKWPLYCCRCGAFFTLVQRPPEIDEYIE